MTFLNTVYNDAWLVKIDASGGLQWQKNYNKPHVYEEQIVNLSDWAYSVTPARDGGYAHPAAVVAQATVRAHQRVTVHALDLGAYNLHRSSSFGL